MASALLKKSITDLTRRKARAVFAVLTLAIAVASIGIFAAPVADGPGDAEGGAGEQAPRPYAEHEAARADTRAAHVRSVICRTYGRSVRSAICRRAFGLASDA